MSLRQNNQSLDELYRLPNLSHFGRLTPLFDLLEVGYRRSFVLQLAELDGLLFFGCELGNTILNECQLQRGTLPRLSQQILKREGEILWLAFVEEEDEGRELLGVKAILEDFARDVAIFDFAEALEYFVPVEGRVKLPEGASKVVDAPGHLSFLVLGLLLDGCRVSVFVRLKSVIHDFGHMIILSLVVDSELENCLS